MVEEEEGRYRRFINASFSTYRAIPRNIDALLIDDNQRTFLSALSSTFRKHLKRLAEDVSSAAELLSRDDTKNHLLPQLEREYDLLYVVEKSWHVCEIFTVSSNKMSMDLVRWLKAISYPQSLCPPTVPFAQTQEPETIPGYWEVMYELAMQGNLSACVEMLQLHSEIANAPSAAPPGAVTRGQVDALLDVFGSYPLKSYAESEDATSAPTPAASTIIAEFTNWQNRVKKLRKSGLPLLSSIPELDTVLRVLLGEPAALELCAGVQRGSDWAWAKLAVAQLLFVHPPPLNRQDLGRVIESCMSVGLASPNSLEKGYITALREVMVGNVGPTLRSLFQLSHSSSKQGSGLLNLVLLLCTAHLSMLLVSTMGSEDLLIPLPDGPGEASFFEEVFLEAAEGMCRARLAPEMVVQYLAVCPQRGREAARALLPYLCSHTDRSVMAVAQLLVEEADWADESSALLRARGMWWLARCVSPPLTSSSGLQSVLIGSTLAKAATFFQAAGDTPRVEALLEASLSRCMWAVASATHAFTGLEIRPTASGPFRPQLPSICDRARSPEDRMAELEGALLEAGELLQAVSADGGADSIVERCCRCLDVYVSAVQVRFAPSLDASSLRSAAAQLAGLVTDQPDYPALPARHWMHVLELVAWLCNCALSLQSECDAVCGGGGGGGRATMGEMEVEAAPPAAQSISREQAYAILAAMQKLECSSLADDLQQSAAPGPDQLRTLRLSLLGIFCASVIQDNASRGAEALRMGDGFLVKSRGERYEERVNSMAMSSRFLRPTARVADSGGDGLQEVFAYELLTGASMSY